VPPQTSSRDALADDPGPLRPGYPRPGPCCPPGTPTACSRSPALGPCTPILISTAASARCNPARMSSSRFSGLPRSTWLPARQAPHPGSAARRSFAEGGGTCPGHPKIAQRLQRLVAPIRQPERASQESRTVTFLGLPPPGQPRDRGSLALMPSNTGKGKGVRHESQLGCGVARPSFVPVP
jgi:hypothetical protein